MYKIIVHATACDVDFRSLCLRKSVRNVAFLFFVPCLRGVSGVLSVHVVLMLMSAFSKI